MSSRKKSTEHHYIPCITWQLFVKKLVIAIHQTCWHARRTGIYGLFRMNAFFVRLLSKDSTRHIVSSFNLQRNRSNQVLSRAEQRSWVIQFEETWCSAIQRSSWCLSTKGFQERSTYSMRCEFCTEGTEDLMAHSATNKRPCN